MSDFEKYWEENASKESWTNKAVAWNIWKEKQAIIDQLENELSTTKQVLGNVIDMEVAKVDNLKAQLNNMEACYIEKKKERDELQGQVDEALEEIQRALNCCESTETACVLGELVKVLRGES